MKDILEEKEEVVLRLETRRTELKKRIEEITSPTVGTFGEFLTKVFPFMAIQVGFAVVAARLTVPWMERWFGLDGAEFSWPLLILILVTFFAAMTLAAWVYLKIRTGPLADELVQLEAKIEAARIDLARVKRLVKTPQGTAFGDLLTSALVAPAAEFKP